MSDDESSSIEDFEMDLALKQSLIDNAPSYVSDTMIEYPERRSILVEDPSQWKWNMDAFKKMVISHHELPVQENSGNLIYKNNYLRQTYICLKLCFKRMNSDINKDIVGVIMKQLHVINHRYKEFVRIIKEVKPFYTRIQYDLPHEWDTNKKLIDNLEIKIKRGVHEPIKSLKLIEGLPKFDNNLYTELLRIVVLFNHIGIEIKYALKYSSNNNSNYGFMCVSEYKKAFTEEGYTKNHWMTSPTIFTIDYECTAKSKKSVTHFLE